MSHYRVCLKTIYACKLRVSEGVELQITQVDSTRMLLNVRKGKGAKERYYGFFCSGNRQRLHLARKRLNICNAAKVADIIYAGIWCPAQRNEHYAAAPKTPRRTNPYHIHLSMHCSPEMTMRHNQLKSVRLDWTKTAASLLRHLNK